MPLGSISKRSARWRRSSSAVGPSVGSQNVSAYQLRGSWPITSSTGSGHGVTRIAAGMESPQIISSCIKMNSTAGSCEQ